MQTALSYYISQLYVYPEKKKWHTETVWLLWLFFVYMANSSLILKFSSVSGWRLSRCDWLKHSCLIRNVYWSRATIYLHPELVYSSLYTGVAWAKLYLWRQVCLPSHTQGRKNSWLSTAQPWEKQLTRLVGFVPLIADESLPVLWCPFTCFLAKKMIDSCRGLCISAASTLGQFSEFEAEAEPFLQTIYLSPRGGKDWALIPRGSTRPEQLRHLFFTQCWAPN